MTIITHCLPSGTLGTNEIGIGAVNDANVSWYMPSGGLGSGNIRGVIAGVSGLPVGYVNIVGGPQTAAIPSMQQDLMQDGWIFLGLNYPEYMLPGLGCVAIWNDINSDSGNGSRYLRNTLHWWDHVVEYIYTKFADGIPIVIWGGSWGGYHTIQIASNRTSTVSAYAAYIPATLLANASVAYTFPSNYGPTNVTATNGTVMQGLPNGTGGLDLGTTPLNSVNLPGMVTYGYGDLATGWAYPGFGSLSPLGGVPAQAYITAGNPYSNTDQIIVNAQNAGMPVIRNATNNIHEVSIDDSGYSASYSAAGPTALSSLSTLPLTITPDPIQFTHAPGYANFNSGEIAILASDNLWHTITYTPFAWSNYCTTQVSNVATSLPSTLTLGSTSGLYLTSGTNYVNISTTGTQLVASYTGVSGNNLTGVSYVSGSGNIVGGTISFLNLINYTTTSVADVTSLPSNLTLNTTHGLNTSGKLTIQTSNLFGALNLSYNGISGNVIQNCTYISGNGSLGGTQANAVSMSANSNSLIGCSYSGSTSATVSLNSPVCMTGKQVSSNYFYKMSFPWFLSQYVDNIIPRKY